MTTQAVGAKSSNSSDVYTFRASLTAPLKRIVHCALIRASLTSPLKRMVQQALIPLIYTLFKGRLASLRWFKNLVMVPRFARQLSRHSTNVDAKGEEPNLRRFSLKVYTF